MAASSQSSKLLKRYFLTYRGVKLPLALGEEVDTEGVVHRETFFCGYFDDAGQLMRIEKIVYGEIAMEHDYEYDGTGRLVRATVTVPDEEPQVRTF